MDKQNIVVTFESEPEDKALYNEMLNVDASVSFLGEIQPQRRKQTLEEAHILLSWNFPHEILPNEYSALGQVRFIQLLSAGVDHVPFEDLPARIVIAGNPGAYANPMAEHVLAMTLALAKRLLVENRNLKAGEFNQSTPNRTLTGMTAGILGFGGIGRATARLMRAFGMKIFAINSTGTSPEPADFLGTLQDLEYVLRESDVVVISLPLINATRGLIGKRELGWMKPDAILVNVARGAIVEEEALYTHAKNHPAFQVGIDAWWTEPFLYGEFRMNYPFLDLPNVLGSPHNSAIVPHILADGARQAAENVRRYLTGEKVIGIARREDYL